MTVSIFDRIPRDPSLATGSVHGHPDLIPEIFSQAFDWPGVLIEAGRNSIGQVENVTLPYHFVCVNVGDRTALHEVPAASGTRRIALAPGEVWIVPAGEPVTLRLTDNFPYIRAAFDRRFFDQLIGCDGPMAADLRHVQGGVAPQIGYLLQALVAEAAASNPGGLAAVETLTAALIQQIAVHAGIARPRYTTARGGLSATARRRALELMNSQLDNSLTVAMLAQAVGLSPAHFARAFRDTLGQPPHRYLLALRLRHARRLLAAPGAALSDVAQRSGFADQAHFTRLFKREFGVTPGALQRRGR